MTNTSLHSDRFVKFACLFVCYCLPSIGTADDVASIIGSYTLPNFQTNPVRCKAAVLCTIVACMPHQPASHTSSTCACMHACMHAYMHVRFFFSSFSPSRRTRKAHPHSSSTSRTTTWRSFLMGYVPRCGRFYAWFTLPHEQPLLLSLTSDDCLTGEVGSQGKRDKNIRLSSCHSGKKQKANSRIYRELMLY